MDLDFVNMLIGAIVSLGFTFIAFGVKRSFNKADLHRKETTEHKVKIAVQDATLKTLAEKLDKVDKNVDRISMKLDKVFEYIDAPKRATDERG